jgi:hypothetical protein
MASSYGSDTVRFLGVAHDSLHNTVGQVGGPAPYIVKFPLTATDSASNFAKAFPVTLNVPAANFAAATVSFKSGDPAFTAFDTVQYSDGSAKYHNFAMEDVAVGNSTAVAYAPYHPKDWTSGYWKREGYLDAGWGGDYIPNWAWTASTSGGAPTASDLQYPYIWYHVTCTNCDTIKNTAAVISVPKNLASVNAYPNPSSKEAVVSFTLVNRADVTVSVSDMTGKVIAVQTIKNVEAGDARINTATLPNGMYLYTVEASGERFNGKISVAH